MRAFLRGNMKRIFIWGLLIAICVASLFLFAQGSIEKKKEVKISSEWTLKELGNIYDIKPGEFKRRIKHSFGIDKDLYGSTKLGGLGISEEQLLKLLEQIRRETSPRVFVIKIVLWSIGLGLVLQCVLTIKNKKKINKMRAAVMVAVLVGIGVLLGPSPNPMESIVQLVKSFAGLDVKHASVFNIFMIFTILSIVAPKFLCSWGCPLGALQECVFNIPFLKNQKFRVPFALSFAMRVILFFAFLLGLLVFSGVLQGKSIFHYVNYFKIFKPTDLNWILVSTLPILLVLSFFTFRPFCHWICPFGLFSWLLETITIQRVRVDHDKCINCKLCVTICPTEAAAGILTDKKPLLRADCWSCGKCMTVCPKDALDFK